MKKVSLKLAKTTTRCSELPRLFSCVPSVTNPDKVTEVRIENGMENLGTDIHAAIQHTIESGEVDFRKIEKRYKDAELERAKFLFTQGLRVVQDAKKEMKNPQFEVEIAFETEKYLVTGHVDVSDILPDRAYIIDFKTGRTRDDHLHQMCGYAVGAWTKMGRPAKYTVRVACVYLESYPSEPPTVYTFEADELAAWCKELDGLDAKRYVVNRRCVYCPLQHGCKTFGAYLSGSLKTVWKLANNVDLKVASKSIRGLPPEVRAELNTALRVADTAVKNLRARIKEEAVAKGDIDAGNGNTYTIRMRQERTVLPKRAMPVVKKYLTPDALMSLVRMSYHDIVEAAIRRVKGPGKALVREKIESELLKAGAVVVSENPYLETVNSKTGKKAWPRAAKK